MKPLEEALVRLRQEFPGESLYEVTVRVQKGERSGIEREKWGGVSWEIRLSSDTEYGATLEVAIAKVYKRRAAEAQIPARAERIAAILREVPSEGFDREHVVMAARAILNREGT
jgi:hypothetical protein